MFFGQVLKFVVQIFWASPKNLTLRPYSNLNPCVIGGGSLLYRFFIWAWNSISRTTSIIIMFSSWIPSRSSSTGSTARWAFWPSCIIRTGRSTYMSASRVFLCASKNISEFQFLWITSVIWSGRSTYILFIGTAFRWTIKVQCLVLLNPTFFFFKAWETLFAASSSVTKSFGFPWIPARFSSSTYLLLHFFWKDLVVVITCATAKHFS